MGTNFHLYPKPEPCPTCGHDDTERLHIGKSSAGWVFAWRGHEDHDPPLISPSVWLNFLTEQTAQGGVIRDEYYRVITVENLRAKVEAKRVDGRRDRDYARHVEGDDVLFTEFS